MIEVSLSQLRAFIEAQPDDREQRMNEGGRYSHTGSFLVHYGHAQNWAFNFIVNDRWVRFHKTKDPETIARMKGKSQWANMFKSANLGTTYKDLKSQLL